MIDKINNIVAICILTFSHFSAIKSLSPIIEILKKNIETFYGRSLQRLLEKVL